MRTFIALNLPAKERYELEQALAPARQSGLPVRWTDSNGLHLTLKFLGEIDTSQVQPVADALQQVGARNERLELRITGFGAFPSLRRASVLWVGVTADPRLLALQRDVEESLALLGYPAEQRPFRPHLTVARTQRGARAPDVSRLADQFDYDRNVAVHTVDLMSSRPGPGGSRYEALVQTTLGKGGP
jgi:2'-5' RNA ligase